MCACVQQFDRRIIHPFVCPPSRVCLCLHAWLCVACVRTVACDGSPAPTRACHAIDVCALCSQGFALVSLALHSPIRTPICQSDLVRACVYAHGRLRLLSGHTRGLVRADMLAGDSSEHEDTVFPFVVEHAVEPDPEPHMLSPPKVQRQGSRAAQPSSQAAGERCQSAPCRVTRSPIALAQAARPHHMHCSYFHVLCPRTLVFSGSAGRY